MKMFSTSARVRKPLPSLYCQKMTANCRQTFKPWPMEEEEEEDEGEREEEEEEERAHKR